MKHEFKLDSNPNWRAIYRTGDYVNRCIIGTTYKHNYLDIIFDDDRYT